VVGIGLLAALPTVYAGLSDWAHTAGAERRVGLIHAATNDLAVACYTAGWFRMRSRRARRGRVLPLAGWLLLAAGGVLGGHLSYGMGVGVDTTAFQHLDLEWTDVAAESEVPVGGMLGVQASGVPVLLVRNAGSIVALADRCTHRGGPLHEGTLCADSVECPWHGSRFRLSDGAVAAGPAVRPQPVLQVRIIDGRVQVRRSEQRSLRTRPVA
jgi:nitrite reductase/ring-hydroxylating ferredoxin subunit